MPLSAVSRNRMHSCAMNNMSLIQNVGIALAAIFVVTCLFIPHPLLIFYVTVVVFMIIALDSLWALPQSCKNCVKSDLKEIFFLNWQ